MRFASALSLALVTAISGFAMSIGCGGSDNGSSSGSGASSGTGTGTSSGGAGGSSGTGTYTTGAGGAPTTVATCVGHVYECGDIIDNDGDGLIDYQDPDCLGPCDNTEDSFYGGISGQDGNACTLDCYFDVDGGSGNDNCFWNHACDPHEVAPNYFPEPEYGAACEYDPTVNTPGTSASCDEMLMQQEQGCYDYCAPLVPNGCDCFGCCELPAGSGNLIWLGSEDGNDNGSCKLGDELDPTKCYPCIQVPSCLNGCDPCEVCIGKPEPDPGCDGGGGGGTGGGPTGGQCETGVQPCGLGGQAKCPVDFYCITGCCRPVPN